MDWKTRKVQRSRWTGKQEKFKKADGPENDTPENQEKTKADEPAVTMKKLQ